MSDEEVSVTPERPRGWKHTVRQPKVWIPAIAGSLVVAAVVGTVAAAGGGEPPATGPSTPTTAADGPVEPSADAVQTLSPTPTASPSASPSASASVAPDGDEPSDGDGGERALPACIPDGTVVAAPKQSNGFVMPASANGDPAVVKGSELEAFTAEGFSADSSRVLTRTHHEGDETATVRNARTLKPVATFASDYDAESAWDNSHTKLAVATTDDDGTLAIRVVNPSSGKATVIFEQPASIAQHLDWSPDGNCVVLSWRESRYEVQDRDPKLHFVTVVDADTGASSTIGTGQSAVYSPNGSSIFYLGPDGSHVKLFQADAATGNAVVRSTDAGSIGGEVSRAPLAFSPNGKVGVYTEHSKVAASVLKRIEPNGTASTDLVKRTNESIVGGVWAPDSKHFAYCTAQHERGCEKVEIVDTATGKVLVSTTPPDGDLGYLSWTPDGKSVVVGVYADGQGAHYTVTDGTWTRITEPQAGRAAGSMQWSYDGSVAVWGHGNTLVSVHD